MSKNLFDLSGKVAVITGGGGVLGGSMAISLAEAGVKIVILDLHKEAAKKRANEINDLGGEAIGLASNVLDQKDLEQVNADILAKWGTIDILINAAGGNMPGATIGPDQTIFDLSIDAFRKVSDLNLNGSVLPSIVFGKIMADNRKGTIINISSMSVSQAITRVAGYSASKAAIENFTRWMAVEMAHKYGEGIRVNAIAPGFFIGEQNRALLTNPDGSYTERGNQVITKTPMGRFGVAEELNGSIHYLCSEASKFVTGIVIPIDGGFSAFSGV
ncbi:MAG: NAD(P)-dependent dehydrogenase (short-subunit alcohol dehydrogenase family) [Cyclobacteriaceae bacterium]|jgi:NAD(P)-dependent dehydrogenase (short-subunit alcohol dehydrogenase family)